MQETETSGPFQGFPIGIHRNLRHFSPVAGLVFFLVNRLESEWVLKGKSADRSSVWVVLSITPVSFSGIGEAFFTVLILRTRRFESLAEVALGWSCASCSCRPTSSVAASLFKSFSRPRTCMTDR